MKDPWAYVEIELRATLVKFFIFIKTIPVR
jgi:hypothetical protein